MKEGNILSFRVLIDSSGNLVTELSGPPEREAHKIFKGEDLILIKKVIREGLVKLDKLHVYLENELDALK